MRYVIKQEWLSWGDDFHIRNEHDEKMFFVDGRAFSLGSKLSFQNMQGDELAFISQRLMSWGPKYEIHRSGQLYATVSKKLFTFFKCKFEVDIPGPDDLEAEGDFLDHEYQFTRHGRNVAQVSKKWFSWTDTYGVDIEPNEDDVLILASAIVIDQVCHDSRGHHHN